MAEIFILDILVSTSYNNSKSLYQHNKSSQKLYLYTKHSNSGTSFSSPIMAGAIACLMQAYPRLSANEIMNIIRESSSQFNNPDYQLGYGIPNLHTAYEFASNLALDNFIVYPIPVTNYLNIISQWNISNYHIDIFDINGKLTYSKYFNKKKKI